MSALAAIVDGSPVARNLVQHQHCPPLQVVRDAEESQHALLFHGAAAYGMQLLACRSREELEEKLEELLTDPVFPKYLTYLKETGRKEAVALGEGAFLELYRHFAGGRADAKVRALAEMAAIGCGAQSSAFIRMPKRHHTEMVDRLEDVSTPVEYADAILSGMRAAACELALVAAFDGAASSLPDEQLETLLDVACDNQRAWLRLIAGLPGTDVPAHIVPAEERLDWNALMDRWDILSDQATRFERAAVASSDGVHFPFGEPHRDRD